MTDAVALNASCPRNVFVARQKSSWVNVGVLLDILRLLFAALGDVVRTHSVVLHMDACRTHLHPSIAKACTAAGVFLMYIPASTTGWLQPLDVSVFAPYKLWVAREIERRRLATAAGTLSRAEVLEVYCRGIPAVMEARCWSSSFAVTGLSGQDRLSGQLMRRLQLAAPEHISSTVPSLADLQCIYPRGANVPVEELFELVLKRQALHPNPHAAIRLPRRARLPPRLASEAV